jgi:nitroreductase
MTEDIGLFEAMYTQRAVRRFKPDPVPDELVEKLIEAATKAPSGSNRQPWVFIVVREPETKRQIGEFYKAAWNASFAPGSSGIQALTPRIRSSAQYLGNHMSDAPVLVFACIEHSGTPSVTSGSSIYPAVQNLLLAARGMGIGSVLTTLHKRHDAEIKALLGIPENIETAALLPLGYPAEGDGYGPTRRRPVEEVTHWERWGSSR